MDGLKYLSIKIVNERTNLSFIKYIRILMNQNRLIF